MEKEFIYVVTYYSVYDGNNEKDEVLSYKKYDDAIETYNKYVDEARSVFEEDNIEEDNINENSKDIDKDLSYVIYENGYYAHNRIEVQLRKIEIK